MSTQMSNIFLNDYQQNPHIDADTLSPNDEQIAEMALALMEKKASANAVDSEPNWQAMRMAAKTLKEKFQVGAAKDAWQQEQKWQAHQKMMQEQEERIAETLQSRRKNKEWYDALQRNDPRTYWSVEMQRAKAADKKQMGLFP
jgi:hypothetical protein